MKPFRCVALAVLLAAGCNPSTPSQPPSQSVSSRPSALDVWAKMRSRYADAKTYRDRGQVTLTYEQSGQKMESRGDAEVHYARPNKLFIHANGATIVSDGQTFRAKVEDESSNNIDNQVVTRPVGESLTLIDLTSDPLLVDRMGNAVVNGPLGRFPLQLDLLLGNELSPKLSEHELHKSEKAFELLDDKTCDGKLCYQLKVTNSHGTFLFCIDSTTYIVRQVEFPLTVLDQQMVQSKDIRNIRLVSEFTGAEFDANLEDDFQFTSPPEAKEVRFFVPPPRPLPSELFGKTIPPFNLKDLDGQDVTRDSMAGKIALLVWFNNHPACAETLQQLDAVYQALKSPDNFKVLAVCTEPTTMSNRQIRDLGREWKISVPIVRDLEAYGLEALKIVGTPTLVILDADHRLQIFEMGANPNLAKQLPLILERITKGDDLAAEVVAEAQRERQEYQQRLAAASGTAATAVVELPVTPIHEATEPKQMHLVKRWSNSNFTAPGNILIDEKDGELVRLLVLDGNHTVVEFGPEGEELGRRSLDLPDDVRITFLRMFRGAQGEPIYAASSLAGQKVYLLDHDWHVMATYPPDDEKHHGVRDVLLADIDGDDDPECYVAFWGTLGLHRLAMDGRREWVNRAMPSVLSIAQTPSNFGARMILATGEVGTILRIHHVGNADPPIVVRNWSINQLVAGRFPEDRQTIYCGVSYEADGRLAMVALDAQLVHQWDYPLPPGLSRNPIEFVTSGMLLDDVGQWVFAAADGSVHIVSSDGEFSDYFYFGHSLRGIAAARFQNAGLLFVSADDGLTAWNISRDTSATPSLNSPAVPPGS